MTSCTIYVEDDTLFIEDKDVFLEYKLDHYDEVVVDLNDGCLFISKCARIQYPHNYYWKIDIAVRPYKTEAKLFMRGGNDVYECATKPHFVVINNRGQMVFEKDFF